MRDGADPTGTVTGDLGDLASGFSLGQQPNDLPVAALHWVFCLPIAGLDVFAILMGFHGDALVHLSSVSQDLISGHTNWVTSLAFAPDGSTLASASWDQTVKLWEMTNGGLLQTLSGHTDRAFRVAWSPDGRTVASCGFDETIWLWDVEQGRYRSALHGHSAGVYGLA